MLIVTVVTTWGDVFTGELLFISLDLVKVSMTPRAAVGFNPKNLVSLTVHR